MHIQISEKTNLWHEETKLAEKVKLAVFSRELMTVLGVYSEIKCFVNYVIPDSGLFEENSGSVPIYAYGASLNEL